MEWTSIHNALAIGLAIWVDPCPDGTSCLAFCTKETICMNRDLKKKPPRRKRPVSPVDAELWLAIEDELDLIDLLLRCVPDLNLAAHLVQDQGLRGDPADPIGMRLKACGSVTARRHATISRDGEEGAQRCRTDILSAPDAMVDSARARLQRLQLLLETMRHQSRRKRGT